MTTTWTVPVGERETRAVHEPAERGGERGLCLLAHGAGSHMDHPAQMALAAVLRGVGLATVRVDFPYRAQGRGAPDRMPVLLDCWRAVIERARAELAPARLLIGGRSMGGRAASMLAADGFACEGLLLFAYPLHPARKTDALRAEHLARIEAPVLCVNGTRDALCERASMERVLAGLDPARFTMHWVEDADHGFHVPRRSGRDDADVLREVAGAVDAWLTRAAAGG
jgi:predicted alpha/beta-hydrolase family hydrolase